MSQTTSNQAARAQQIVVPVATNNQITVDGVPGAKVVLQFEPGVATATERSGNDLVFSFEGGGKTTVKDFFVTEGKELPTLQLPDGAEIPSATVLASLNSAMDLSTAAGPAASATPPGSGGIYASDPGDLIDGIDRLGSLGTIYWDRDTEVPEAGTGGPEFPGGSFGIDVNTNLGGMLALGLYEDGRANQHVGDQTQVAGQIIFTPNFSGSTTATMLHLNGFDPGTKLYLGDPANGGHEIIADGNGTFNIPAGQFAVPGIFVLPPADSDHDMTVTVVVDVQTADGMTGSFSGTMNVIVDAVADKPEDASGRITNDVNDQHHMSADTDVDKGFDRGFNTVEHTVTASTSEGALTVAFQAAASFGDYKDGSESHYLLVEKLEGFEGNYTVITVDGKEYFQVSVDGAIGQALVSGPGTYGDFTVDVNADGTVTVTTNLTLTTPQITADTDYNITVGAMAVEHTTDNELRTDNNVAYDFTQAGNNVQLHVDVIDSKLTVQAGWASEDNNNAQHDPNYVPDYNAMGVDANSTSGLGAPINFNIAGAEGSAEHISSVTIDSYDTSLGTLYFYDGSGSRVAVMPGGSVPTNGTGSITGLHFEPAGNSDADVTISYTVGVINGKGASATYNGSVNVIVDAVADKPTGVKAEGIDYTYKGNNGYEAATDGTIVKFTASAKFTDLDGSEKHYVLVEQPTTDWKLCDSSGNVQNYPVITGPDGVTKYFQIEVPGNQPNPSIDVYVKVPGGLTEGTNTLGIGGMAVEQKFDADVAGHKEITTDNNTAWALGEASVEIKVDYLDATSKSEMENAYEDNNDMQYQGAGAAPVAAVAENGEITISLEHTAKDTNSIIDGDITISFKYNNANDATAVPGKFYVGTTEYTATNNGDGTWYVKVPGGGTSHTVRYESPTNDDTDLTDVKYSLTIKNQATGETSTSKWELGGGTLIVDAVADKATDVDLVVNYKADTTAVIGGGDYSVQVKATFDDYKDGSESHFIVVDKGIPDTIDINNLPAGITLLSAADAATFTTNTNLGTGDFVLQVSDAYLQANGGKVDFALTGKTSGQSADGTHIIKIDAVAVEGNGLKTATGTGTGEITERNNLAVTDASTTIKVAVITSEITVGVGRAYEDNMPKANELKDPNDPNSGPNDGKDAGADITVAFTVGNNESIVSATFTINGVDGAPAGIIWNEGAPVSYTDNGNGTYSFTIPDYVPKAPTTTFFKPSQNYSDADVDLTYSIIVKDAGSGQTKEFTNAPGNAEGAPSISILVDAVADLSEKVTSDIGGKDNVTVVTPQDNTTENKDTDKRLANGFEHDEFSQQYTATQYSVNVHVNTTFKDLDGSETHFILIEKPAGWTLGTLPPGYKDAGVYPGSDDKEYFKIEVINPKQGLVDTTIPLKTGNVTGDMSKVEIKTGSLAVETEFNGREFDNTNDIAERLDGTGLSYSIDVINSTLKVDTGWASEGGNDAKHLGQGVTNTYNPTLGVLGESTTGNDAKVNLSISATDEHIDKIVFTYDDSRGSLWLGTQEIKSGEKYDFSNQKLNDLNMVFKPVTSGDKSYDSSDVNLTYTITVGNNSGASAEYTGLSTVVIDAVADLAKGGRVISQVTGYDDDANYTAADWGSVVQVKVTAEFLDFKDGSETHYLLVEVRPGFTCTNADGKVAVNGVTYYYKTVNDVDLINANSGKTEATFNFKVSDNAGDFNAGDADKISKDGTVEFKTGGLSIEGKITDGAANTFTGKDGNQADGSRDIEYNTGNNVALAPGKVGIDFNVINEGNKGSAQGTFEDNDANKHEYGQIGTIQSSSKHVETTTTGAEGNVTIKLVDSGTDGVSEHLTSVKFSFDFDAASATLPGKFTYMDAEGNTHVLEAGQTNADGSSYTQNGTTWTVTIPPAHLGSTTESFTANYEAPHFDNTDLTNLNYTINVAADNSKATSEGITGTVTGVVNTYDANGNITGTIDKPGTLVVDAVADKPAITQIQQGDINLDPEGKYPDRNPANAGKPGTGAAAPGDKVVVEVSVTFQDCAEGGERHYIVIHTHGWNAAGCGSADGLATSTTGQYYPGAATGKLVDVNEVIKAAFAEANGTSPHTYTQGGITVVVDGTDATVTTHIQVQVPGDIVDNMSSFPLTVTGLAIDQDKPVGMGGFPKPSTGSDDLITTLNDKSVDTVQVNVPIQKLTSQPTFTMEVDSIYENLAPNAHKDPNAPTSDPAKLTIDNVARGETASVTLIFSSTSKVDGKAVDFTSVDTSDVMHVRYNGVDYPVEFDGTHWKVSLPSFEGKAVGVDATFEIFPGKNYNDFDIKVDYIIKVEDNVTHETQIWSSLDANTAKDLAPADYYSSTLHGVHADKPFLGITVDAVAQQPGLAEIHADGREVNKGEDKASVDIDGNGRYDFVKAGENVFISAKVEFFDYADGSERHAVLVQQQPGWTAPHTIRILNTTGNEWVDVPVTAVTQSYNGVLYHRLEISNDLIYDLYPKKIGSHLQVEVVMKSPVDASGTESFKVGAMAWEDHAKLDKEMLDASGKPIMENNQAFIIGGTEAVVKFDTLGGFSLSAQNNVYENNTPNAHMDMTQAWSKPIVDDDGNVIEGGPAIIAINLGASDVVTDFHFTNMTAITGKGTLTYVEDSKTYTIDSNGYIIDSSSDPKMPSKEGHFEFLPKSDTFSDDDVPLNFNVSLQNKNTGETTLSGGVNGSETVEVDAVAQLPSDAEANVTDISLSHDVKAGEDGKSQTASFKVTAEFSDFTDTSEAHYVLVQAIANTTILNGDGKAYTIYDGPDGVQYFKIPVGDDTPYTIDANGTVTVDVNMVFYSHKLWHSSTDTSSNELKIGALAVEAGKPYHGQEATYHNNEAFMLGDKTITITHNWPGGTVIWVDPASENDTSLAHKDDGNLNGTQPNETTGGDAKIYLGSTGGEKITSVDLTWDENQATLVVRHPNGTETVYNSGSVTISGADLENLYLVPNYNFKDIDLDLGYVAHTNGGKTASGSFPVVIDAVAQMPEFDYKLNEQGEVVVDGDKNPVYDTESKIDYGKDLLAVGAADKAGNDGIATVIIGGKFHDYVAGQGEQATNHYALLEARPGMSIVDINTGTVLQPDTIYLEGKMYYKFPITGGEEGKAQYVEVGVKLGTVAEGTVKLQTGLLSEEPITGGPGNYESTLNNNVAWNLDGKAEILVSLVNTGFTASAVKDIYENGTQEHGDQSFAVNVSLTGQLGSNHDEVKYIEFQYKDNLGELKYTGPGTFAKGTNADGETVWRLTGLTESDWKALGGTGGKFTFTPNDHADQDISISWKGEITDTLSGDITRPSGTINVIVDAVAEVDASDQSFGSADNHAAAVSGGVAHASVTLHFPDTDGSEIHYAVIEQNSRWTLSDKVIINGVEHNISDFDLTTLFSDNGTPYHAIVIPNSVLNSANKVDVTFVVNAPENSKDISQKLGLGGISVEGANGIGDNKETNLNNNWAESLDKIDVSLAVVEATKVTLTNTGNLIEDDTTGTLLNFGSFADDRESVMETQFTVTQVGTAKGSVIGKIVYDGAEYEVKAGQEVKITFGPDGCDPTKGPQFILAGGNHNSGKVTINTVNTVEDLDSGDQKVITGDKFDINVVATADAPTDITITDPKGGVGANANVTFTVSAKFADIDGSEQHYILVEAKSGWTGSYSKVTVGGTDYFQIPVIGTAANPTASITLKTPVGATDDVVGLKVGGMAVDGTSKDYTFEDGDKVTVTIGVVDTKAIGSTGGTIDEGGSFAFNMSIDGKNEVISKVVLTNPPSADMGKILYNGQPVSISGGKVTITDANGIEANKISFQPNEHWSGKYEPNCTVTVKDGASNVTKDFTNQKVTIEVTPVATAPTDLKIVSSGFDAEIAGLYTVKVSAKFADTDGSENHYFLVKAVAGLVLIAPSATMVDGSDIGGIAGTKYYVLDAGNTAANPEANLQFIAQEGYNPTSSIEVHAISEEMNGTTVVDLSALGTAVTVDPGAFPHYTKVGTDGADDLFGTAYNDHVLGGAGDDIIHGSSEGNDILNGEAGHDTLDYSTVTENLTVDLTTGIVHGVYPDGWQDKVLNFEAFKGGSGDDIIMGSANDDLIFGGKGNDLIFGGAGNDTMFGGDGSDTFKWTADDMPSKGAYVDVIKDFGTGDQIDVSELIDNSTVLNGLLKTNSSDSSKLDLEISFDVEGGGTQTIIVENINSVHTDINAGSAGDSAAVQELISQMITLEQIKLAGGGNG